MSHRRLPEVCRDKGHRWKQEIWGVLGYQVCARRNCDERRIDPRALAPEREEASR